ncbi:hypothetical protein AVEN_241083-1 [Araneus ventricosus]|uniref:Uncharacterized protein n=1 Tax=Araneus ventricosus TaxID=182803 RepID=A0A4Y2LLB9_ARAVE|nr:hypothetical protein AVEN_241083-1 [Araneus ventricosus]
MEGSMNNNKGGSQKGKYNQRNRRTQNTQPFRSPIRKSENTKHKMCRDATVDGVSGFFTPDGNFYPYKPTPTLDLNKVLNDLLSSSSQLDSTKSSTPDLSSNSIQEHLLPSSPLGTSQLYIQESSSLENPLQASVSPQGGLTTF